MDERDPSHREDNNWVRIGRVENAIDNLRMTVYFLKTFSDIEKWKWAIIALHQTLYSFFIIALVNCGQKVVKGKWLIDISAAAKMLGEAENLSMWDDAKPLKMDDKQATAFVALVRILRNNFEHFNTDRWSIEINMIENIFEKMIQVVRFITLESNTIWFSEEQEIKVKNLILQLETIIDLLHKCAIMGTCDTKQSNT
jgi:hypothetical protein